MHNSSIARRDFGLWAAAVLTGVALPVRGQNQQLPIADMHSHYGMFLPRLFGADLAQHMQTTGTSLVAWAIVDDSRWLKRSAVGIYQSGTPGVGELWAYFEARLSECQRQLAQWNLPIARTASDVDAALAGQPRVLLATEAANFLEGDLTRLALAHAAGVRHLQLVHYIGNPVGDFQTAQPVHGGLTAFGRELVAQCARLGVVVDLAHGTPALVDAALEVPNAAFVWSHSWIRPQAGGWQDSGHIARALSLQDAKKIAQRDGVVGLWSLGVSGSSTYPVKSVADYANEIMRMCDLIGPEHVAFGTDMDGVGARPVLANYTDLRQVADDLSRRGLTETQLRGILIGNYARVVKRAMNGASA